MTGSELTGKPAPPELHPIAVTQTLHYAVAPALGADSVPLVVGLHGWGQTARKMLRDLAPLAAHGITVAAPQAPHPFYLDMESAKVGFHWLTRFERDRAVADTNEFVAHVIEAVAAAHPVDPARIYLLGFSQGCSMAWRFCVSGQLRPAGMIACGADLPPDVAEKLPGLPRFPALLVHGREDSIIAPQKMHDARAALTALGVPHEVHEFDGGHEIPPPVAEHIARWILGRAC